MGKSYYGKTASINQVDEEYYEVETRTTTIHRDLPIQISFFVYNHAKLR